MVKLRIQELAEEKVYRLLSLTSGVSEEAIQKYAVQTTEDFKKIATALNWSVTEPGVEKVFQMLNSDKAKDIAINLLSRASKISENKIKKYVNEDENFNITEKIDDLRKIATALDVKIIELVKPREKRAAVKLKISELARKKGIELKDLAEQSGVYFPVLCFYSSQPIEKIKLEDEPFHTNLINVCKVLSCSIQDLQDEEKVELPLTRLRVQELLEETGLTVNELSLLSETTLEFIDLVATNPIDMRNIPTWGDEAIILELLRKILP
ncbi:hypothetical protein A6770_01620 [Nostoc minutum NIES-26]|uniref:HTH cro/C1-type domain-containing protein n=1 Tax=Nostoc minutum NIES-26 TaxID=1844469 RepID=A0A367R0N4_9NOSO|nr:hypothetical protein A6770_01620 [Nostoc minutum NIES-26]